MLIRAIVIIRAKSAAKVRKDRSSVARVESISLVNMLDSHLKRKSQQLSL